MGDMGDMYRDWDSIKKDKKAERFEQAMEWLKSNNVPYESKNSGYHLIFKFTPNRMDFWPTTNTLKIGMRHIGGGLQYIQRAWQKLKESDHNQ